MSTEVRSIAPVVIVGLCLALLLVSEANALPIARKYLAYGLEQANCETEMALLDNYVVELQNEPETTAYVVAYGGRRGMGRSEMRQRRERIKRYLVENRGIDTKRVVVVNGGFRESLAIELWLTSQGEEAPKATPTVSPKSVRYKRAKYSFNCSTFY